jgi:hypothetical protein
VPGEHWKVDREYTTASEQALPKGAGHESDTDVAKRRAEVAGTFRAMASLATPAGAALAAPRAGKALRIFYEPL